jgi:rhomboid protease GluP
VTQPAPPSSVPARPRPVYSEPQVDGRLVPPRWLDGAPVTTALMALNLAVFLVQMAGSWQRGGIADFSTDQLLTLGASYPAATIGEHRWETLVTACFLHGNIAHITFNMLALWQAGPLVERAVGSARMAPMYLLAGIFGYVLSVAQAFVSRSGGFSVGASGAISGVIAAALVVGWRVQGWHGPLTQAMARWLGFLVVFGLLMGVGGGHIDNAAHIGGAVGGAAVAWTWRRGYRYTAGATAAILAACVGVLAASIAVLAWHDRTDRFAAMSLEDRSSFTMDAIERGRCRDALDGLAAVDRLRAWAAPVTSLRTHVEAMCGR